VECCGKGGLSLCVWYGLAGRGNLVQWGRACTGLPEESELQGAFDAPVGCALEELTWLQDAATSALGRLCVHVGREERKALLRFPAGLPGCVCLYGPPGCGKTSLALALAQRMRSHSQYLVRRDLNPVSALFRSAGFTQQAGRRTVASYI
jgi:hypothetical protein